MHGNLIEAAQIRGFGGVDQLDLRILPAPRPGAGELLVDVEASGVAYADVLMRQGIYPETPHVPFTPGYDLVGRVVAAGDGVREATVGDRVAALTVNGANATRAVARASRAVRVPEALPAPQVVALVLNWVTAQQMLHRVARVPRSGSVLVHGAAGGVGTALLDLARLHEVRAYGSASGDRVGAVRSRGGVPLDRGQVDVIAEVRHREPDGVHATFDPVGGPLLHRSRSATRRDGTVVSYGISFGVNAGYGRVETLVRHFGALARAQLTPGATTRLYTIAGYATKHPTHFRADLEELITLLERGRIRPQVTVFPLREIAAAHGALEAGEVSGKAVLVP